MSIKRDTTLNIILFDEPSYVTNIKHGNPAIDVVPLSTHSGDKPRKSKYKVYSPVNGTVVLVGWDENGGNSIKIKKANGSSVYMCHFANNLNKRFKVGDKIKKGQYIGIMGNTGHSRGAHVHIQGKNKNGEFISREKLVREMQEENPSYIFTYAMWSIIGITLCSLGFAMIKNHKSSKQRKRHVR